MSFLYCFDSIIIEMKEAFLFPLYAMYGPIVPEKVNSRSVAYWRYIIAGLVFYLLLTITLIILL